MVDVTIPDLTANTTPATTALVEVSDAGASGKTTLAQALTAALATKTANTVLAGPTTGAAAAPAFRALVVADVPTAIPLANIATFADLRVLANVSGGSAIPAANTVTAILDACLGSTKGQILYRDATVWTVLAPGPDGKFLKMVSGVPAWGDVV